MSVSRSARVLGLSLVLVLVGGAHGQKDDSRPVRFDFDDGVPLASQWRTNAGNNVRRIPAPDSTVTGVRGHVIRVQAKKSSGLQTKARPLAGGISRLEQVRFAVRAEGASKSEPAEIEAQIYTGPRAWFWRKVVLDSDAWQEVVLPLKWFRWSSAVPDWRSTTDFGFWFRTAGTFEFDGITFEPGSSDQAAWFLPSDVAALAFDPNVAKVRRKDIESFAILTDDPKVALDDIAAELTKLGTRVRSDFPTLPKPPHPVPLVIFSEDAAYREFWPRLGKAFAASIAAPRDEGFTALGISTASADPKNPERVRPVFVHEACHAYLARALGIPNQTEWLHEGLANHYQVLFSGQDLESIFRKNLPVKERRMPLSELLNGKPISGSAYWQAVSVVRWMMDAERRPKFVALLADLRDAGSTNIARHVERHFGVALPGLEEAWLRDTLARLHAR